MRPFLQTTIALVYDFDGTLSPRPMQEYTVLPAMGVDPSRFWADVNQQSATLGEDPVLCYMRVLAERAGTDGSLLSPNVLRSLAARIEFFPGVDGWFERMNSYVLKRTEGRVQLRHYVISAGLHEVIDGTPIRRHLHNVFASRYHYDGEGRATFPAVLVTDTTKTQYLFRINKGREGVHESINEHMDARDRAIPFGNMIYIGDGLTDVPSMAVTRQNGGNAIAVFPPDAEISSKPVTVCTELQAAGRASFISAADYREGSDLSRIVQVLFDAVIERIGYERESSCAGTQTGKSIKVGDGRDFRLQE